MRVISVRGRRLLLLKGTEDVVAVAKVLLRGANIEDTVEVAKGLLADAEESLDRLADAAYAKAVDTEDGIELLRAEIARKIKELESYRDAMVSDLERAGEEYHARGSELEGKAKGIARALEYLI